MKLLLTVVSSLLLTMCMVGRTEGGVVDSRLADALRGAPADKEFPVIVTLADEADIKSIRDPDRSRRRAAMITHMKAKARYSQRSIKAFLSANRAQRITPLWIINGIAVTARPHVIETLAAMPGIKSITLDATLNAPTTTYTPAAGSWGIEAIGADAMWSLGYTGQGIVIATLDTGVDGVHPDLAGRWRGGSNSWFDPHGQHASPYDASGHGTQVMGIILGSHSGGTSTGIAPDAQWISAKLFNDAGSANDSDIHQCFEWVLDPDGDPNTDDAPDIVNNSWGFSNSVNECVNGFEQDVEAIYSAGIAVIFSAGNAGPNPSTSVSPANYATLFSVGSVNQSLTIDSLSSRGPSTCTGDIFPNVVAPGVSVSTCDLSFGGVVDNHVSVSGTSFSAPHLAGAFALLRNAFPALSIAQFEWALKSSARDLGTAGPDNTYGNGFVDVVAAYQLLLATPPSNVSPVAADDHSVTNANMSVAINVLANDSDLDSAIDPAAVMVTAEPANGTTDVNPLTGVITYSPTAGFGGADSFTYTVADVNGAVSNVATVTIAVNDVITVTMVRYYRRTKTWEIRGTAKAFRPNNSITIHLGKTLTGTVLATVNVSETDDWIYIQPNSSVAPDATHKISFESAIGTSCLNFRVSIIRR